jgi:integrase
MGEVVRVMKNERGTITHFVPKKDTKYRLDGEVKQTYCSVKDGDIHLVYPLKEKTDIDNMKKYFSEKVTDAVKPDAKKEACRNLLLWIFSINVGLRMSDILKLTWGDIFHSDGSFKDAVRIKEKKTKKGKDFYLNTSCKNAINEFINNVNPLLNPELHIFKSREGGALEVQTVNRIIKMAGKSCGIKFNLGTHSCRKTWAYQQIMAHQGDAYFMAHLMHLLNHSSQAATLKYVGLEADQDRQYYNDVNL